MKPQTDRPLDPQTAWGYLVTNLGVLPGMGSLLAGYRVGYLQAALSLGGMVLSLVFLVDVVREWWAIRQIPQVTAWHFYVGGGGLLLFLAGWCWALATSLGFLRRAREEAGQSSNTGGDGIGGGGGRGDREC